MGLTFVPFEEQALSRLSIISTPASENQTLKSPQQEALHIGPPSSASLKSAIAIPDLSQLVQFSPKIKVPSETPTVPEVGSSIVSENLPNSVPSATVIAPSTSLPPTLTALPVSAPLLSSSTRHRTTTDLVLLEQTSKIVEGANGTIIIEELDTPAIRRAKNLKRKEEKREQYLRRDSLMVPPNSATSAVSGEMSAAGTVLVKGGGAESELSSLSEFGSEAVEESGKAKQTKRRGRGRGKRKSSVAALMTTVGCKLDKDNLVSVSLAEDEKVEGGTLGTPLLFLLHNGR